MHLRYHKGRKFCVFTNEATRIRKSWLINEVQNEFGKKELQM